MKLGEGIIVVGQKIGGKGIRDGLGQSTFYTSIKSQSIKRGW